MSEIITADGSVLNLYDGAYSGAQIDAAVARALRGGEIDDEIDAMRALIGPPLVAQTKAKMTDTGKIYVYTGSESGMINGNWYYWNGTAWVSGGVYNAVAVQTDKTLSISDMPADAKVTGEIREDFDTERSWVNLSLATEVRPAPTMRNGWGINMANGVPYESAARCGTRYRLAYRGRTVLECKGTGYQIFAYCYSDDNWTAGLASLTNGRYIDAPCVIPIDQPDRAVMYALSFRISSSGETVTTTMFDYICANISIRVIPEPLELDGTLTVSGAAADAAKVGDRLAMVSAGNAPVTGLLETTKNWFNCRTLEVDGAQALYYHDGHTILDETTTHTTNIECSTFVTMSMRGLQFWDTSYAVPLDTAAAPASWKANPQMFWALNPYTTAFSHLADGTPADPPNTRYAAAVANMMCDYGTEVDVSDIRPGDILFFARRVSAGGEYVHPLWFKKINHIGICYAVHETEAYPEVYTLAEMTDTSSRYVYRGEETDMVAGDWYYYNSGAWHRGGPYVDPAEFPLTHEMIHCQKDEADSTRNPSFVPPWPTFVSDPSDIGSSSQGKGHGSIFIEQLESIRGDDVNGIDTLCCVCRPAPGSLWAERRHFDAQTEPIKITSQPKDIETVPKSGLKCIVIAEGSGLTYQWQYCAAGTTTWANTSFVGARTNVMTLNATAARNGYQYRCKITDGSGNIAYSRALTLTVV